MLRALRRGGLAARGVGPVGRRAFGRRTLADEIGAKRRRRGARAGRSDEKETWMELSVRYTSLQ